MKRLGLLLLFATMFSCTSGSGPVGPVAVGDNPFLVGKADGWNWLNDPERFARFLDEELIYQFDLLPLSGATSQKAWPASYWPTRYDSTNYRWDGADSLSPMEKYDIVFNGWVPPEGFMALRPFSPSCGLAAFDLEYYDVLGPAALWMSENRGNWRVHDGIDNDNDGQTDECVDADGIAGWWGLCHAWTPASMIEEEPNYPVTMNGVTFFSSDIKALLLTIYDSSRAVVIGGRCRTDDVERDENGRILDLDCRDTNAGTFHVILTNFLGRYQTAFAEDRTYNVQVWNQPVQSYKIDVQTEVDEASAIALTHADPSAVSSYPFNEEARRWVEVEVTVKYLTESHQSRDPMLSHHEQYLRVDRYHYLLELDGEGLIVGGEWINGGSTHSSHGFSQQPDFLWYPIGPRAQPGATAHGEYKIIKNPHISYTKVKELLAKSLIPPTEN